jgi:hypothetical protein
VNLACGLITRAFLAEMSGDKISAKDLYEAKSSLSFFLLLQWHRKKSRKKCGKLLSFSTMIGHHRSEKKYPIPILYQECEIPEEIKYQYLDGTQKAINLIAKEIRDIIITRRKLEDDSSLGLERHAPIAGWHGEAQEATLRQPRADGGDQIISQEQPIGQQFAQDERSQAE